MAASGEGRSRQLSPPIAMRVLAAILTLACSCHLHAQQPPFIPRLIHSVLSGNHRLQRVLNCAQQLGPIKCLNAFSVWRAGRALESFVQNRNAQSSLIADIEQFSWKQYYNVTDEQLYSELCDGTERLLEHRSLQLSVPGYRFELESRGNGTLNVDVLQNSMTETESGRGHKKKFKKMFYKIVPFLLLPGLLMSAVLPFVLPALKMMTIGVGILNNMALSGAIFTLLRNNAFNDKYEHKVLYVNAGYKNEKHAPLHFDAEHPINENYDVVYAESNTDEIHENKDSQSIGDNIEAIEEVPLNPNWMAEYGGNKYFQIIGHEIKRKGG